MVSPSTCDEFCLGMMACAFSSNGSRIQGDLNSNSVETQMKIVMYRSKGLLCLYMFRICVFLSKKRSVGSSISNLMSDIRITKYRHSVNPASMF